MNVERDFAEKCLHTPCRSCKRQALLPVLDLGPMPLSDGLLTPEQLAGGTEERYPLEVAYCPVCSLVQILETVPPEKLFCEDYPYYSSFSETLLQHSRENALSLIESRRLTPQSLVVELASNDGYLLKNFVEKGVPVLGIDPAAGPAREAVKIGVPTMCAFFGKELALDFYNKGTLADVIIANNVLAHVADTNGFVEGIRILMKDTGVAVIEVPYVRDLIDHCEFDTIYHEHLCYFSVTALDRLFRRYDLFLNNVKRLPIHGGSLRLYIERKEAVGESVRRLLAEEATLGVDKYPYYEDFSQKVQQIKASMRELLCSLKQSGKRIAAYGAAAKGAIMLNYIGVGREVIDFVVDKNVHKQGKFMPGVHVPICDPAKLLQEKPDFVVILPWNFRDEILHQQEPYRQIGGKFIVAIPQPQIL
ncbi:MAG TPA: class I SAM-dependent methyltransferase [Planctomycetota bacterium]|nr:class I SAM-dependent methyltransferase [Planctomycetota bacterium]